MTAAHKRLWPVVCIVLVLGLVALQATAATPSGQKGPKEEKGQKGKKDKDKGGGAAVGNPLEFKFFTDFGTIVFDVRGDRGDVPYEHTVDDIKAAMGHKGNAHLDTGDSGRGLNVDFYDDPPQGEDPGPPECVLGPCQRPTTLPSLTDPVFAGGVFLRFPTDLDLRGMMNSESTNGTLAIRIITGEDSRVRLVYGPLTKKGLEPCWDIGEPEGIELSASVTRLSATAWQVEGQTARVTEEIGKKSYCRGYVDMPVFFTIRYLQ